MDIEQLKNLQPEMIAEEIYKKNVELLEQRRRTEQLLYNVSEVIIAVDTQSKITLFNHTAEKFLHIGASEAMGQYVGDLIKLEDENGNAIEPKSFIFQGDPLKANLDGLVLKAPDKDYYVNLKTSVILQSEELKECLITLVDITREKQLEKTKDEFISITSHELRTPITIIKSYLWVLDREKAGELNPKQREYLSKAINGAERMLSLVNDTLNIARIEQGKMTLRIEEIDPHEFVNELVEEFRVKTDEKGLVLTVGARTEGINVLADKSKFREILINFLSNSFKFTSKGGITISIKDTGDGTVRISVIDTGKGIDKEDIHRLFNKFGRLDNSYQTIAEAGGTGLGLYITKSLVEKMGGKVGVFSEGKEKGATFWFSLPIASTHAQVCTIV